MNRQKAPQQAKRAKLQTLLQDRGKKSRKISPSSFKKNKKKKRLQTPDPSGRSMRWTKVPSHCSSSPSTWGPCIQAPQTQWLRWHRWRSPNDNGPSWVPVSGVRVVSGVVIPNGFLFFKVGKNSIGISPFSIGNSSSIRVHFPLPC